MSERLHYRVDADDRISLVDSRWLAFARENGAAELTEERVLGRRLWDFIADAGTREMYQAIHHRIRTGGHLVVLPFRCDSPTICRHMRLTIAKGDDGRIHYESALLRAESRSMLGLLAREFPRSDAFLTACSCCKRGLIEPVGWLDIEEVAIRLRLFEQPRVPKLRYALCPECVQADGIADVTL